MADPKNPEAAPHRPFLVEGDYPSNEYEHADQQSQRRWEAKHESGPLYGDYTLHPDRAHPRSPEEYEADMERAANLRAMHGGLPDSSPEMPAVAVPGGKPFKV